MLQDKRMPENAKFIMIGTCRGADDEQIVNKLKLLALELGINHKVEFEIN